MVDQLVENLTCRRKTIRWIVNVWMYMLEIAAHDAFILYRLKYPDGICDKLRERQDILEAMCTDLIMPNIRRREKKGFVGIKFSLRNSFENVGVKLTQQIG